MRKQNVFQNAKVVDGTPYHVDFPDDWINTEDNEQIVCDNVIIRMKTGPRFCGNCLELGVDANGIFVEYCLNCDDYVYNGARRISQRSTSVYQKGLNDIRTASNAAGSIGSSIGSNAASSIGSNAASSIGNCTASSIGNCTASSIGSSVASSIGSSVASSVASNVASSIASNPNNIPLFTNYTDITSDY